MSLFLQAIRIFCLSTSLFFLPVFKGHAKVNFLPTAHSSDYITPVGGEGSFSMGVFVESTFPLSKTFSTTTNLGGGDQNLRYQVPIAFGVELAYGLTDSLELGAGLGFDSFEAQQLIDQTSSNTKVYNIIRYRFIPIVGILRYRWMSKKWSPEIELAAGVSLGSIKARTTIANIPDQNEKKTFLRGHVAAGAGYAWASNFSIHFQLGYGVQKLGEVVYNTPNPITQKSLFHGVFAKSFVRFYF